MAVKESKVVMHGAKVPRVVLNGVIYRWFMLITLGRKETIMLNRDTLVLVLFFALLIGSVASFFYYPVGLPVVVLFFVIGLWLLTSKSNE
jgi:hypothetical protein